MYTKRMRWADQHVTSVGEAHPAPVCQTSIHVQHALPACSCCCTRSSACARAIVLCSSALKAVVGNTKASTADSTHLLLPSEVEAAKQAPLGTCAPADVSSATDLAPLLNNTAGVKLPGTRHPAAASIVPESAEAAHRAAANHCCGLQAAQPALVG